MTKGMTIIQMREPLKDRGYQIVKFHDANGKVYRLFTIDFAKVYDDHIDSLFRGWIPKECSLLVAEFKGKHSGTALKKYIKESGILQKPLLNFAELRLHYKRRPMSDSDKAQKYLDLIKVIEVNLVSDEFWTEKNRELDKILLEITSFNQTDRLVGQAKLQRDYEKMINQLDLIADTIKNERILDYLSRYKSELLKFYKEKEGIIFYLIKGLAND